MYSIKPITDAARQEIAAQIIESWGSHLVVSLGTLHDTRNAPGFVAVDEGKVTGYALYN